MTRKVLSAEIAHETNTFSLVPTTLEDFENRLFLDDPNAIAMALKGTNTEITAHIDAADVYGWDLRLALAAQATPGGKVEDKAWHAILQRLDLALAEGGYDGVILGLHGAMVSMEHDDAEGALLQRIRDQVGEDVPIVVTLDLHANVTDDMARLANAILPFRTYPHIDQAEISRVAADILNRAMEGEISPRCLVARPASLLGCNFGRTQEGPMADMLVRAERITASDPNVHAIGISSGFPWADVSFAGPSVAVTYEAGHAASAWETASDLVQIVWRERAIDTIPLLSLDDAVRRATAVSPSTGPLVIGDTTDNPGGGAYGDSVRLLEALLAAGVENAGLAAVRDPECVEACFQAGVGRSVSLTLGSKVDPAGYGPPLTVEGNVAGLDDTGVFVAHGPMWAGVSFSLGRSALVRIGGISVVLSTHNIQITDRATFELFGIDPAGLAVIAVKSSHHFRAGFEPIAREVILVDSGGLVSPSFDRFDYTNLRRPIWPLDPMPEDAA